MKYSPRPIACSKKLEKLASAVNLKKSPMFIGWDVYCDIDGRVGFYEGNSCPMALPVYSEIFGGDLNLALVDSLRDKGVIGLNANLETETSSLVRQEAGFVMDVFKKFDLPYVTSEFNNVAWDGEKLFFNDYTRKDFSILFNRVPWGGKFIRRQVPDTNWIEAKVLNPIVESLIISNKLRTSRALNEAGIETPLSFRAENEFQYRQAARSIMEHIEEEHPNYKSPFILSKPISGTGQNGILIFNDDNIDFSRIVYPCMVSERITSWPYENIRGTFAADIRMFSLGDYASHGVGKIPYDPIFDSSWKINNRSYVTKSYTLELDSEAEQIIRKYVLAASVAIANFRNIYMRERKK
jgi:hypothetical protein